MSDLNKLLLSDVFDLLSDYADIRDELDDALTEIRILCDEMELAMSDISDELDRVEEHISGCSRRLRKFRGMDPVKDELPFKAAPALPPDKKGGI